jgi:predicted unusual protein kinase regulating ubiquinone biosynthesis (AarF/ABC1/UbiB family)
MGRLAARRGGHWVLTRARSVGVDEARRTELEDAYALRSVEDVVAELGEMKGVLMKLGQLASVVVGDLPPAAAAALDQLQADVPPMAGELAARVVAEELGAPVERCFASWDPEPVAAASIGQVHRARLPDGRAVAVKVQYPGAAAAIRHDLANAEGLYALASATLLRGLDSRAVVDELRERMDEELDYRIEAANQSRFADRYRGHPFLRVPDVVASHSAERVLTTAWADGAGWSALLAAPSEVRDRAGEIIFRFAQAGLLRHHELHGDPHPGNYRFGDDGTVTVLDFGMVKRWTPAELAELLPVLDPVLEGDAAGTTRAMVAAGFLAPDHGLDPGSVFACVGAPYRPYLVDSFTFMPTFTTEAMATLADLGGPDGAVLRALDLPPTFVVLNRVLWSVSGLLGRLGATNRWRAILDEYRVGGPPATALGEQEQAWARSRR